MRWDERDGESSYCEGPGCGRVLEPTGDSLYFCGQGCSDKWTYLASQRLDNPTPET